jgi:hypothetical protein
MGWIESPYAYLTYGVHNPQFPRVPEGLGPLNMMWGNMSAVAPFGSVVYFMVGGLVGRALAVRVARRWGWPPVRTLLAVSWVVGFSLDCVFENVGIWCNWFHYERAVAGLALFPGTPHMFPLYMSTAVGTQIMLVAYLLGRANRRGVPVIETAAAQLLRGWPPRLAVAVFSVVTLQMAYLAQLTPHIVIKSDHLARLSVTRPIYPPSPNQPL